MVFWLLVVFVSYVGFFISNFFVVLGLVIIEVVVNFFIVLVGFG